MKTMLYGATTVIFLVAGHISLAMAGGPQASDGNTWAARSSASDTTVRTAAASPPVTHQTRSNALPLTELDPEVQRLYDEIMHRAGVPLSELR